ncbi:MAG: CopM family metallochaperone [Salipiger thiooxidans]|uniref:CopM family metallochaperone n=1 Tax=Salipiger thiooxidans TaxID=282683 RepID=UPI001CFBEEE4|nr:DUF305 domain-containing protein [Salipiger thiooxidans]
MNTTTTLAAGAFALLHLVTPAFAEEPFQLPGQCGSSAAAAHDMHDMDHMEGHDDIADGFPEHVRQNLAKMQETMPAMEQGMKMEDADVAFACGMIAHHQAAIDMAEVLLAHGKDTEMRRLAEEIIAAQGKEIAFMTDWLAKTAK